DYYCMIWHNNESGLF
nr:immunoglobulin light chain junction region [Macaca mulatta]MOX75811.1 immunoglobulin light chain junction region [Macaca mulatta]